MGSLVRRPLAALIVAALLVLLPVVLLPAAVASAQDEQAAETTQATQAVQAVQAVQAAEPTIELAVLGSVPNGFGVTVPIEVTVVSPRAARGTVQLRLLNQRTPTTITVPVDLPANTPVRLPLAVPSSYDGVNVEATLSLDGLETVTETLQRWGGDSAATVGLIGIEASGETVGLGVDAGTAMVRELDDASIRSAGLSQMATLVVSPGGLRGLGPDAQNLVLGWLGSGGDIVVVGAPGSIDDVLPSDWTDGARPGAGRARYSGPEWETALLPSAAGSSLSGDPSFVLGDAMFDLNFNGLAELAVDAGLGLLGARSLLTFLGIYALIAGPVMYLVLKRIGRLNLAWTALPMLAVVFTVAAVVVGAGIRGDRTDSHATIIEVQPMGSTARSTLLLTSGLRGDRSIELPPGWNMIAAGDLNGNGSSAPISLRPERDRTTVTMDLDAGGAGVATFEGGASMFDDAVRITGLSVDDTGLVSGRVTNNAAVVLSDVVAFAGAGVAEVGTIEPSQTVDFTVEFSAPFTGTRRGETEFSFWPAPRWGEKPQADIAVGSSNWGQWRTSKGPNVFAPGLVGVVGWTNEVSTPAADIAAGRTALVARVGLPTNASALTEADIDHVILSTPDANSIIETGNFFGRSYWSRVNVPPGVTEVVAEIGAGVAGFEVWDDGWKWVELDEGDDVTVTLPPEAFVDGTAWLRTSIPEWSWPPSPGLAIVPSTAGSGEAAASPAVLRGGAVGYRTVDESFDGRFGPPMFPIGEPIPFDGMPAEGGESTTIDVPVGEVETFVGELRGAEVDSYVIGLEAGDTIGVELRSRVHDSYLVIRDDAGRQLADDDDSGRGFNGTDSRLIFDVDEAGTYTIEAHELGQNGQGGYELVVERDS